MTKEELIYAQATKEIEEMDIEALKSIVLELKTKYLYSLSKLELAIHIYDYNS